MAYTHRLALRKKVLSFQFSRWQVPLLARSKVSPGCSQFAVSSHFNFLSLRLASYLNSWSSKEAAIASEGSSLLKPSLPVRKYVGTAPNPYPKKASKLNFTILRGIGKWIICKERIQTHLHCNLPTINKMESTKFFQNVPTDFADMNAKSYKETLLWYIFIINSYQTMLSLIKLWLNPEYNFVIKLLLKWWWSYQTMLSWIKLWLNSGHNFVIKSLLKWWWIMRCTFIPNPEDSIRDAWFTVSPNRQYRGIFNPTTPAHTGPEDDEIQADDSWNVHVYILRSVRLKMN